MIGDNVTGLLEPPGGELIQNLSFIRNTRKNSIECGKAIGGDYEAFAIRQSRTNHGLCQFACSAKVGLSDPRRLEGVL